MSELESMSRDALIELAQPQAARIVEQDVVFARQEAQITALATQLSDGMDRFEEVSAKLARVEHLLSRNSDNSNYPSSKDGGVGGKAPSLGFVHGLLKRTAELPAATDRAIRALITLCFVLSCDETPLKVGGATPAEGKKEAKRYLLVAYTELYTHYLLGDRSLDTFKQFVFPDLADDAVIVHDR